MGAMVADFVFLRTGYTSLSRDYFSGGPPIALVMSVPPGYQAGLSHCRLPSLPQYNTCVWQGKLW